MLIRSHKCKNNSLTNQKKKLQVLKANTNKITDLTSTPTMKELNELYLQNNSITSLSSLSKKFPQLESLDLKNNNISNSEELVSLSSLSSLADIWVEGNPFCRTQRWVDDSDYQHIIQKDF
jgi:Leucine-rich repeat (LRR) protein